MDGSLAGTDSWFNNPANQDSSTHFGVGFNGDIHQYVRTKDVAWANGVLEPGNRWPWPGNPNRNSISIETEGHPGDPVTNAMYNSVLWLCRQYKTQVLTSHHIISPHSRPNCAGSRWTATKMSSIAQATSMQLLI